jgi:hypothetical protein
MEANPIFSAITNILNWTYDIRLKTSHRDQIAEAIRYTWNSKDTSARALVGFMMELSDAVFTGAAAKTFKPARRDKAKPKVRALFKKEFTRAANNNWGNLIRLFHSIIEELSPGVTGVSHRRSQPVQSMNTHLKGSVTSPHYKGSVASSNYKGSVGGSKHAGGPYRSVSATAPMSALLQQAGAGASNNPQKSNFDPQAALEEARREKLRMETISQIRKMQHETAMAITRNI